MSFESPIRELDVLKLGVENLVTRQSREFWVDNPTFMDHINDCLRRRMVTYILGMVNRTSKEIEVWFTDKVRVKLPNPDYQFSDKHLPTFKKLLKREVRPAFTEQFVEVKCRATVQLDVEVSKMFPEWTNKLGFSLYELNEKCGQRKVTLVEPLEGTEMFYDLTDTGKEVPESEYRNG